MPKTDRRARTLLTCALLVSVAFANGRAQTPDTAGIPIVEADGYERPLGIDVLHYEIALDLPNAGSDVRGRTTILYEVTVPLHTQQLHFDFGAMTVDSVAVDGISTSFDHVEKELRLRAPRDPRGRRVAVTVWYHGTPDDGLIVGETRHGGRSFFADNWADRAHHWFPSIDHPSDKASVAFEVVAPAGLEVIANGVPRGTETLPDGRRRWRWSESSEIPTYGMVVGATDFAITRAGRVAGVEVTHWAFQPDSLAAEAAFARSVEILGFYDSLFGPFPYEKLAHVQSATKYGGMENPTAIFYGEDVIGQATGTDAETQLVAHETVHQWFGDAVTEADWNHLWLSEGFATYFATVFFEFHGSTEGRGAAELTRRMAAARQPVVDFFRETGKAIYDPGLGPGEYEGLLNANNYPKGAWVLHMLRREIGDEAFFAAIRDFYAAYRDHTVWTADFERVAERHAGAELDWFFAQWVGRAGHPVIAVDWRPLDAGRVLLGVEQTQGGEAFRFPLEVELRYDGGSRRERLWIDRRRVEVVLEVPANLIDVVVDPDAWLLHERAERP